MRRKLTVFIIVVVCLLVSGQALAQSASPHPLDPLTKDEIAAAVQALRSAGKATTATRFSIIVLNEPPKPEVLNFKAGAAIRRQAFVVIYERGANKTFEAVVDLADRSILSWKEIAGAQPALLFEDYFLLQSIVRGDARWQEAMRKRGITDFQKVQLDPWSAGNFGFPEEEGKRIFRAVAFYRGDATNAYARPVEGVVACVDLVAKEVLKLVDTGVVPLGKPNDYDAKSVGRMREAPAPLQITQPQGTSYTVEGNEVRWQKWRFRYAMHPREGLVLYTVGYEDGGRTRTVLYRASLSEMVVPYGDPGEAWFWRNAFDEGEYNLGRFANSLEPMTDAPPNARFLDALFAGETGGALEVRRALAIFERDGGVLWKHFDGVGNRNESRRSRELVLSWIATAGNYEYVFSWVLRQDGSLEMEVGMTGIMLAKGVNSKNSSGHEHANGYGHLVAENVEAVHHQHFFNFRLDFDVDGATNSLVEMNTEARPAGRLNPYSNAFAMQETPLKRERDAQRQVSLAASRRWKVINPAMKNSLGQPVGYLLVPGENSIPYAAPNSSVRRRAGFLNAHLWATLYDAAQMNAAGYYINQSKGGDGLVKWAAANRPLENQDIVLWYTLGVTHIPRPEEWPVMSLHRSGFKLLPAGFFVGNPALDVPKENGQ
jgi:primary-amine oxidase